MQSAHDLDIEWLERMASWLNEVDASVNTVVNDVHTVDLVLRLKISIKSLFNVLNNRSPGVVVVDEITKSGGVNYRQSETDAILLNVCTDGLYRDGFWDDVEAGTLALLGWVERGVEKGIDKSRFTQARLT